MTHHVVSKVVPSNYCNLVQHLEKYELSNALSKPELYCKLIF